MRTIIVFLLAGLVMLSGCSTSPQPERQSVSERRMTAVSAPGRAVESLGSAVETLTIETPGPGWTRVTVILRSLPSTQAIDLAAAGILAAVASATETDSPISLNFVARGLGLPESPTEWGSLGYGWYTSDYSRRGSVVQLFRSGADNPHGLPTLTAYASRLRGYWRDVDVDRLESWSQHGPPEPVADD